MIKMNYGCAGLVAVISGGTSGIGLAVAEKLLLDAAEVYLLGRNKQKGTDAVKSLKEKTQQEAFYLQCDVTNTVACQKAVAAIDKNINILINSAGVYLEERLENMTDDSYAAIMDTNVKGTLFLTKAVMPHLYNGGSIVNIASDAGVSGNYGCPLYCASKGAIVSLTRALALDMAPSVRVNCVCPADVDTPLLARQLVDADGGYTLADMASAYPMGRIARAEEIAHVICSVVSPQNSFMTGSIIVVDGGLTAN